jgi:hypothetical protein
VTLNAFDHLVFSVEPEFSAAVVELQVLAQPALRQMTGGAARAQFCPVRVLMAVVAPAELQVLEICGAKGPARCHGFMALHTRNAHVLSLETEFSASVVERQVLALPPLRDMTHRALCIEFPIVRVLVAV